MKLYSFDELPENMIPEILHPNPRAFYYIVEGDRLGAIYKLNLEGAHPVLKTVKYEIE